LCVVAAVALRFLTTSPLWLDEALSVNIARLPLDELLAALRRDGSPPLYYLVLHGWISIFGASDLAVRALSGVVSLATAPLLWLAAKRTYGDRAGVAATAVFLSSPFAIRYATETRMYALAMLLAVLGYLLVRRSLERPSWSLAVAIAAVSGALMLTHYWSFHLIVIAGAILVLHARRVRDRKPALITIVAIAAGGVFFLPWLTTFLFQLERTGTPWGRPASLNILASSVWSWGGGSTGGGPFIGALLFFLLTLALFAYRSGADLVVSFRVEKNTTALAILTFGPLLIAVVTGWLSGAAYAERYSAIVFVFFVLLVARGLDVLPRGPFTALTALVVVLGLVVAAARVTTPRTQAGDIAEAIEMRASSDAIVAYCPDQLGPAVARELPAHYGQVTFPRHDPPALVNWTGYEERHQRARIQTFAAKLDGEAGSEVWLVWADDYRTLGMKCERLVSELRDLGWDDALIVGRNRQVFESANLSRLTRS